MKKTFEDLMVYVLKAVQDGNAYKNRDIKDKVSELAELTVEEKQEVLSSGTLTYKNRTDWAIAHLYHAGLIYRVSRGVYALSTIGKEIIKDLPDRIDCKYLMRFDEYAKWSYESKNQSKTDSNDSNDSNVHNEDSSTPEEKISSAMKIINENLADELLAAILANSPSFFENLVVQLLVAMGYGGMEDAKVVGGTGDDGIDGIINSDKLGFEKVCIQAKRYSKDNTVSNQEIRNFSGALLQKGVTKGVFITTSSFSPKAINAAKSITQQKIVLIDGEKLTNLMIEYNIGVSEENKFVIKKFDSDFFEE